MQDIQDITLKRIRDKTKKNRRERCEEREKPKKVSS
jgi:hypothetical protein